MSGLVRKMSMGFTYLSGLAILFIMGVTLTDIFTRTALNFSLLGTYDMVQLGLVVAVYGGLSEAFRRNAHIAVDLIDTISGPLMQRISTLIILMLVVALMGLLTWLCFGQAYDTYIFGDITMDLRIPKYWHWIGIISCLLMTCLTLIELFITALLSIGKDETPDGLKGGAIK